MTVTTKSMSPETLLELLAIYRTEGPGNRCVVICRDDDPGQPFAAAVDEWRSDVRSVEDLGNLERHALAIVCNQLSHMSKQDGVHLLAQLRDRYAGRVLACDETGGFTTTEMLSLGFTEQDCPQNCGRVYLHNPEDFFERRAWNNADDWAHPENFEKRRW